MDETQSGLQAAIAEEWAGLDCLLDGQAATIAGRRNRFATIRQVGRGIMGAEATYSWPAVERIMESTGQFWTGRTYSRAIRDSASARGEKGRMR